MAPTKFIATLATLSLVSLPALAQANSTSSYSIVQPTQTPASSSDFVRPGDVSPEEFSRVLEEADRIRAFQAAKGAATTTYVANANSGQAAQPQTYAEYIAARRQAQLQAQAQTVYQPQQPTYQPRYLPQYQPRQTYPTPQPVYQQPVVQQNVPQQYVQAPMPQNRVYQAPVNNPVIYAATPNVTGGLVAHTVVKGDTLYSLSKRYGVSLAELKRANGLSGNLISVGQRLNLPGAIASTPVTYSVPIQNTVPLQYTTPTQYNRHTTSPSITTNHVPTSYGTTVGSRVVKAVQPVPPSGVYAVLPNDTVYGIARFACVNPYDVARLNGITETASLVPGQKLSMPAGHCLN